MKNFKKVAGAIAESTMVPSAGRFISKNLEKAFKGKAEKEVGLQDSLDKTKKMQIIKDRIKEKSDDAESNLDSLRHNQNNWTTPITKRDVAKGLYEAKKNSYDFGNGDKSLTPKFKK